MSLTLAVAVLGASSYYGALRSQAELDHVAHSNKQLSAARQIDLETKVWTTQLQFAAQGAAVPTEQIAATRDAVDAAVKDFTIATTEYLEYVEEDDAGADERAAEQEESERAELLQRLIGELALISEQAAGGQAWTAETRERIASLSRELSTVVELIEADEVAEVEQATATAEQIAKRTTLIAAILLVLAVAVTVTMMSALSGRLRRAIGQILEAASAVGRGDLNARAAVEGEDEFAELGGRFDEMVVELQRSLRVREEAAAQARVLAREAGIAQVTTGVLHNIGNALNSVNISLELVTDSGIDTRLSRLAKVGQMLAEHEHDLPRFLSQDPRGSKLPRYLAVLGPELEHDAATFNEELARLGERVDHVIRILRTYQEHGIARLDYDSVDPLKLTRFAVEVALPGARQRRYTIEQDSKGPEQARLDKHRTLEILINLIRNAADALDAAEDLDDPRLELLVEPHPEERSLRFIVRDNGIGVAAEDLDRIFGHGYTTKGDDGQGFGLHASANAAVEMGGRLSVHSDGPGKGATFTLDIPLRDVPDDA